MNKIIMQSLWCFILFLWAAVMAFRGQWLASGLGGVALVFALWGLWMRYEIHQRTLRIERLIQQHDRLRSGG